jgi:hypothetical protein
VLLLGMRILEVRVAGFKIDQIFSIPQYLKFRSLCRQKGIFLQGRLIVQGLRVSTAGGGRKKIKEAAGLLRTLQFLGRWIEVFVRCLLAAAHI